MWCQSLCWNVFHFSSVLQWTLTPYILVHTQYVLLIDPAGSFTLSEGNVLSHVWWCTVVITFGGDCFRTSVPCFHLPFLLQFNDKLFCCNLCFWEDFCSSCSSSAWSSDWRRRLLDRAGRSCYWLARMTRAHIELFWSILSCGWHDRQERR